ncbi:MAG: RNA polymerase sigma factor [Cyclobacteriaceae bacterium]
MITNKEENALIDRIVAGERALYAQLVDQHKSYAFTIALKIVGTREDAEEVAQDAFIKAFQYLKTFNKDAKFSTWLYRIVFNTAISHKRKNRVRLETIDNKELPHQASLGDRLEQDDKIVFLSAAMKRLNEQDQHALQLFYLKELTLEEVAEVMNQNINTIKVRVHRARIRLAEELKKILAKEALTL